MTDVVRRRSRGCALRRRGVLVMASTASAWVWSTNLYGRIACRIVSTDGAGAPARVMLRRELVHHLRVGQRPRSLASFSRWARRTGAKPGRLDRLEVPAAALDVEEVLVLADEVPRGELDRGVAAAVQHQRLVAAEQARGVNPMADS